MSSFESQVKRISWMMRHGGKWCIKVRLSPFCSVPFFWRTAADRVFSPSVTTGVAIIWPCVWLHASFSRPSSFQDELMGDMKGWVRDCDLPFACEIIGVDEYGTKHQEYTPIKNCQKPNMAYNQHLTRSNILPQHWLDQCEITNVKYMQHTQYVTKKSSHIIGFLLLSAKRFASTSVNWPVLLLLLRLLLTDTWWLWRLQYSHSSLLSPVRVCSRKLCVRQS